MSKPTTPHMARYRQSAGDDDDRLIAPTFLRNNPPMIASLAPWLSEKNGTVLEIGAGTGQHAAAFSLAFPNLVWRASDPDAPHRKSIMAWARELNAPIHEPLNIDAGQPWHTNVEVAALAPLKAVISMNVIHISPVSVMQGIFRGAGHLLDADGLLIFYGPFQEFGLHTGEGNANFDAGLRAENSSWGLRDIDDLDRAAEENRLTRAALLPMPANNRLVIFKRASD